MACAVIIMTSHYATAAQTIHCTYATKDGDRGMERGEIAEKEHWLILVHNKYNTTFLGVLANHIPLFYNI